MKRSRHGYHRLPVISRRAGRRRRRPWRSPRWSATPCALSRSGVNARLNQIDLGRNVFRLRVLLCRFRCASRRQWIRLL